MDDAGRLLLGKVVTLEGEPDAYGNETQARVAPFSAEDAPTLPLTIPWYLRGAMGELETDTEVVYTLFPNQSGIILQRADGEWSGAVVGDVQHIGDLAVAGDMEVDGDLTITGDVEAEGTVKAEDLETEDVASYNTHVHTDVTAGDEDSGEPKKE